MQHLIAGGVPAAGSKVGHQGDGDEHTDFEDADAGNVPPRRSLEHKAGMTEKPPGAEHGGWSAGACEPVEAGVEDAYLLQMVLQAGPVRQIFLCLGRSGSGGRVDGPIAHSVTSLPEALEAEVPARRYSVEWNGTCEYKRNCGLPAENDAMVRMLTWLIGLRLLSQADWWQFVCTRPILRWMVAARG